MPTNPVERIQRDKGWIDLTTFDQPEVYEMKYSISAADQQDKRLNYLDREMLYDLCLR